MNCRQKYESIFLGSTLLLVESMTLEMRKFWTTMKRFVARAGAQKNERKHRVGEYKRDADQRIDFSFDNEVHVV